jgi:hypothetical protein
MNVQAVGEGIIMICGLAGLAALLLFLVPRTPKHTFWVLLAVLLLSLPLFILLRRH